jgi:hypothetical protein
MYAPIRAFVGLAAVSLIIAACGGSSSSDPQAANATRTSTTTTSTSTSTTSTTLVTTTAVTNTTAAPAAIPTAKPTTVTTAPAATRTTSVPSPSSAKWIDVYYGDYQTAMPKVLQLRCTSSACQLEAPNRPDAWISLVNGRYYDKATSEYGPGCTETDTIDVAPIGTRTVEGINAPERLQGTFSLETTSCGEAPERSDSYPVDSAARAYATDTNQRTQPL